MRAARVLDMLLVLQRRGRVTARELADTFEVSERTVLRDVEALSEAGVPIYATRGGGGGIELMDGFQTNLTGLTASEAQGLFLCGQPRVAHRLGLGQSARAARNKLLNALSTARAVEAEHLQTWFLHDPDPWAGNEIPHGELRRVSRCIAEHRFVEITLAEAPPVSAAPIGLVLKAGAWHLVHTVDGVADVVCIDQLRATRLTKRTFDPPLGFDLDSFWKAWVDARRQISDDASDTVRP